MRLAILRFRNSTNVILFYTLVEYNGFVRQSNEKEIYAVPCYLKIINNQRGGQRKRLLLTILSIDDQVSHHADKTGFCEQRVANGLISRFQNDVKCSNSLHQQVNIYIKNTSFNLNLLDQNVLPRRRHCSKNIKLNS